MVNIISFDFEEVNAAVFRNAQIYKRKKKEEYPTCVITPVDFEGLYKDSDFYISIDKKTLHDFGIDSYSDVLEHIRKLTISEKIIEKLYALTKFSFLNSIFVTPRINKFYIKNGLEKRCLRIAKKRYPNFKYFRGSGSLDVSTNIKSDFIDNHFIKQFGYLRDMIEDGALYESSTLSKSIEDNKILKLYLNHTGPKILLRTRNFKNKAVIHNTKSNILLPLLKEMILMNKELLILNVGCPILSFDLPSKNYLEYNKELSFYDQLYLCSKSDYNLMTSEGGLFVAFAASKINLIQYDEEWSVEHCGEHKISLFEARTKNKDLNDIDIRKEINQGKYIDAAKIIFNNILTNSKNNFKSKE